MYHTFMELFKILKFDVHQSIKDFFKFYSKNKKTSSDPMTEIRYLPTKLSVHL